MQDHTFKAVLGVISTLGSYLFGLFIKLKFLSIGLFIKATFLKHLFDLSAKDIDTAMQRIAWTCTYILFLYTMIHFSLHFIKKFSKK